MNNIEKTILIKKNSIRLLWIAVKLFDKSVDKATWLEMMENLQDNFDISFMTGWRDHRIPMNVCGKPIQYFPQIGSDFVQKISRHLMMKISVPREIARSKPNIVLMNCLDDPWMVRAVFNACRRHGCRPVLDVRTLPTSENGDPIWTRFANCIKFASQKYAGVTYITEVLRQYCYEKYLLPDHLSTIWSSGVNANLFRPTEKTADNGCFRLIYHGGVISVSRGLDRLVQAMGLIRDLNVHLTLISSLREPEVIKWIDRLNLHDSITLMDTIPYDKMPIQIQQCDAGILPFPDIDIWNTSSPIKLFEYMACGKPVVATYIPAHRNVLADKPYAFYANDASPFALSNAIRKAYESRNVFKEIGKLARQQVIEQHTWRHQAEKMQKFLLKL